MGINISFVIQVQQRKRPLGITSFVFKSAKIPKLLWSMPDKTNYTLIVHIDPKGLVTKTFPKSALGIANLSFPRDMNCVVSSKAVPPQCGHNSFAATALLRSSLSLHLLPHFSTWYHSLTYFLFHPCEKALMQLQKSFTIFFSCMYCVIAFFIGAA